MAQAVRDFGAERLTSDTETIVALSSGRPPAAIAVIRISGPAARSAGEALGGPLPPPRRAALRTLRDPRTGDVLDRALMLVFPGPNSATGEDVVEFQIHGGRAVADAVVRAAVDQPGCRAADAGEFTRRAFFNGRIDLVEAEGLADLLAAETQAQRRRAIDAADGHVSRRIGIWIDAVLALSARVEATIDFADEDDVGDDPATAAAARALAADMAAVLDRPPVERLRDGVIVALAGPPNAGKSTALNALAGRDAAIVSPMPGTTRDRIELAIVRDGRAYRLVDTAGMRDDSVDPIEREGIARAERAVAGADILLWLGDDPPPASDAITLWLQPRSDEAGRGEMLPGRTLAFSAATGGNLAALWTLIADHADRLLPQADEIALNLRQRDLLDEARAALTCAADPDPLIAAEHLRAARHALDRLTGRVGTEDMLDAVFGRFCIGK